MAPGEPETNSVPASASPAFLLIDRRERYLSSSKLFPWFKRVIFSDKKNILKQPNETSVKTFTFLKYQLN